MSLRATFDFIRHRRAAYCQTFMADSAQAVLEDLAKFCRADRSCFDADPRLHAVAEGRREVWLRIQQHLHLSPEELFAIFSGRKITRAQLMEPDTHAPSSME